MRPAVRVAVVAAAVGLSVFAGTAAWSAVTATSSRTQSVTSDSWGVTPESNTSSSAPNLSWSTAASALGSPEYFRLVNTGTDTLTASTVTVVISGVGNSSVPDLTFTDCSTGWTALGTCTGTQTNLGSTSGATTVSYPLAAPLLPAAPGSALSIRVSPSLLKVSASYTVTLTATVTAAQVVFPKSTTNS